MKPWYGQIGSTWKRLDFYARGYLRELAPRAPYERQRKRIFAQILDRADIETLLGRVNYYNKLQSGCGARPATRIDRADRSKSRYFFDIAEYLKYYPAHLKADTLWGDVTEVPEHPTILKSRPVGVGNVNSVLFNLDKLRHYRLFPDDRPWSKKTPKAVWRGRINNRLRADLVRGHGASAFCDVGHIGDIADGCAPKTFLSPAEQLNYRYIISVEGNDVATNLKWIMASNSICLMPAPRYETWFMEGRLIPGHHFVLLKEDFSDLEEKIDMLESNPAMAKEINENARSYVRGFLDRKNERQASLLVLQKYFEATGQLPASPFTPLFFKDA